MLRETVSTAVVGGGVSGLYSAWRLAKASGPVSSPVSLNVYEASDRLGGRLDTVKVPPLNCSVEMGAMRFTISQLFVSSLLAYLNVPTEVFKDSTLQYMFLRDTPIPMSPSGPLGPVPYRLAGIESPFPFALFVQAMERAVPGALSFTPDQWAVVIQKFQLRGRPLWQWGFWNLLQTFLSNEAYQLVFEGLGEQSVSANWNAAFAMPMMCGIINDAEKQNGILRPTGGWVTLVDKLAEGIRASSGCVIETQTELRGIRKTDDAEFPLELRFAGPREQEKIVAAKSVILALPREALERIEFGREICPLSKTVRLLEQVVQIPAFKLYAAYDSPWWSTYCGWTDGYSISDLPIRQVYYGAGQAGGANDTGRILMASYADFTSVPFWTGLIGAGAAPTRSLFQERSGAGGPLDLMLEFVNAQLRQMHGILPELPKPIWSAYVDWTRGNYGAGWHAWQPGLNPVEAVPRMRQPFDGAPIYICGETFSYLQGWVEGALSSAELMLEEKFSLPRPDWLPSSLYLGP